MGRWKTYYRTSGFTYSSPGTKHIYCVEEHVKLGTPGGSDGVLEIWIDGVQTLEYYNQPFLVADASGANGTSSLDSIYGIQIYKQNGDGFMYYDQVAAGDTRIGCGAAFPTNTTPPAAPKGLRII